MFRTPASIPNTQAMMHRVRADVGNVAKYERCLSAMFRSGRLKKYDRSAWRWMRGRQMNMNVTVTRKAFVTEPERKIA